jgi:uncharacterized membrane protein
MNKTDRNILILAAVALSCGWVGLWVDRMAGPQPAGGSLGMGIWLVAPLLTVLLLRVFAGDGWTGMGLRPNLRGNVKWYLAALLIYPLVTAATLLSGRLFGWADLRGFNTEAYLTGFAVALLPGLVKNFFEESVWRGWLTSRLLTRKVADTWLYLIVGGVWGLWHLPYYLHFLPHGQMLAIMPVGRLTFAVVALISMLAWTVMFVELYRLTRSIWPVVVLHTMEDAIVNHLVIEGHAAIAAGREIAVSPVVGLIPTAIFLGVGLLLRRCRMKSATGKL